MRDDERNRVGASTARWLCDMVVGLNLCPFAARPWQEGRVRLEVASSADFDGAIRALLAEVQYLLDHDEIETSLLVYPHALISFEDLLDGLGVGDELLARASLTGDFQLVGFHPDFCFEGAAPDDQANFTNRSPFPMIHILRERSVTEAVQSYGDTHVIPQRNVARLRGMPASELLALFQGSDGTDASS